MDEIRREISLCVEKGHLLMSEKEQIEADIAQLEEQTKLKKAELISVKARITENEEVSDSSL